MWGGGGGGGPEEAGVEFYDLCDTFVVSLGFFVFLVFSTFLVLLFL